MARVLLVSGSLRRGSTNGAALTALAEADLPGVEVDAYEGLRGLPHFDPDDDVAPLPPAVSALRAAIAASDAVLFCTPEYAGTLPGSFKNLLDWCVGGVELGDRPVAWINVATSPLGGVGAHETLRVVLGYVGATIVEEACVHVPVGRGDVGPDGRISDPELRADLAGALAILAGYRR
ncbi:MAG: NAD(P)H-dependent oxidoreductase [Actinomycetia bacterium]|nr:NAD(P)H-dependent oxidoreductase [Actinomycetes bacterium]